MKVLLLNKRPAVSRLLVVLGVAPMSASLMTMTGNNSIMIAGIGFLVALLVRLVWWRSTERDQRGPLESARDDT